MGIELTPDESSVSINHGYREHYIVPFETVGRVRTVRAVSIMEYLDAETKSPVSYFLHVFQTPAQAQAFAKRIKRGCDQSLQIGDECSQVVIITPDMSGVEKHNDVQFQGDEPSKIQEVFFQSMPIESMDDLCGFLNCDYALLTK